MPRLTIAASWTWAPDLDLLADGATRRTFYRRATTTSNSIRRVIYCVVPEALADDLLDKLENYYADDPNVTVMVDRRKSSRREGSMSGGGKREVRDRRRPRIPGELPELATD
jgi:hypothetical protein